MHNYLLFCLSKSIEPAFGEEFIERIPVIEIIMFLYLIQINKQR